MEKQEKSFNWPLWSALGLITIGITIVLLFAFPPSTKSIENSNSGTINDPEPVVGAFAPEFSLFNLDSERVELSDFKGQPVLINFWATLCAPCRIEMPAIQDRFEKFAEDGLVVLAVDFAEPRNDIQAFKEEFGLTFELLLDPEAEIQRLYRIRGYPTSLFIDSNGVVQVVHIGLMTEGQLDDYLSKIGLGS